MKKKLFSKLIILCILIACSCVTEGCRDATVESKNKVQVKKETFVEDLESGLYDTNLQMLEDWNTLISNGTIKMKNGDTLNGFSTQYDNYILVIDDSVTEIGEMAFYLCNQLKEVVIPDTVTKIGKGAFGHCVMLDMVYGASGVTEFGEYVFTGCSNLKTFSFAKHVSIIKEGTFQFCEKLDGIVIPDGVTILEADAFYGCEQLEHITIPDSMKEIGAETFLGCAALSMLKLPESIESIGEDAFLDVNNISYTGNLVSRDNWGAKTLNGYVDGDVVYEDDTKKKLTGVSTKITEFEIPNSVVEIGQRAFFDCNIIKSVTIPKSVESIGKDAFLHVNNIAYTGKLTSKDNWGAKTLNGYVDGKIIYKNKDKKKLTGVSALLTGTVIIPDSVTEIGAFAFYKCEGLEAVTIPDTVVRIEQFAFSECNKLKNISIPNSVKIIKEDTFFECKNLESVTLSNRLKKIETGLFFACENLRNVVIPDGVIEIGENAFFYCYNIENLVIPNTVTKIGYDAFYAVSDNEITYNGDAVDNYEDSNGRWAAKLGKNGVIE